MDAVAQWQQLSGLCFRGCYRVWETYIQGLKRELLS